LPHKVSETKAQVFENKPKKQREQQWRRNQAIEKLVSISLSDGIWDASIILSPFLTLDVIFGMGHAVTLVLGQADLCNDFVPEVFTEVNTYESALGFIVTADPAGAPTNNRCVNALPIELDTPTCGNTEGAVHDFFNQALCGYRTDRPAIWYEFKGTGNPMTGKSTMDFLKEA
jgi:hypothetical protein